ncbi:MAG: 2-oxo acid dehydrogenase subunit E2, partial [Bacteroidota bacterium]
MTDPNSAYVDELYFEYLRNPDSVSPEWKEYFAQNPQLTNAPAPQQNGNSTSANASTGNVATPPIPQNGAALKAETPAPAPTPAPAASATPANGTSKPKSNVFLGPNDSLEPLNSLAEKIAANMENSLRVPTATSIRTIPVKALEENRVIINTFLTKHRKKKISFTHILAWAIVRSLKRFPQMNDAYAVVDGKPTRVKRGSINMGLAVDTTRKDGMRSLVVPSIKNSQTMNFAEFVAGYDGLIAKSRTNKLTLDDMMGASVSLTNPGMIGTEASVPRLMEGQGLIIAAGSIDYPAEFGAVMPDALSSLAISKVVTVTSTYDHRIIQGAESGEFLQYMHKLLTGEEQFYDQIFASLHIPFEPMRWTADKGINPFLPQDQANALEKETRVVQMINSYRVRGHLLADINPLGHQAYHFPELNPASYGFTIWDLDREFDTGGLAGLTRMTLRNILEMLREVYCGTTGIEYMHMQTPEKKLWVQKKIEHTGLLKPYDKNKKEHIFKKIVAAEVFENFLHTKFLGQKRFS